MTFAERLKELREGAGLTEAKLAERSGLTVSAVRSYARTRKVPSFDAVVKLAAALAVTCEAFAGCSFDPPSRPTAKKKSPTAGAATRAAETTGAAPANAPRRRAAKAKRTGRRPDRRGD